MGGGGVVELSRGCFAQATAGTLGPPIMWQVPLDSN